MTTDIMKSATAMLLSYAILRKTITGPLKNMKAEKRNLSYLRKTDFFMLNFNKKF